MIRRNRKGFILLMVLVLLAVAAAVLAELSRASMRGALAAADEADELQRRWGSLSCQAALLPHAELLLQQAEATSHKPVEWVDLNVTLGGQAFSVRIADEQAKLNLNTVFKDRGRTDAEAAARQAARSAGRIRVDSRPWTQSPFFESFGQVFSDSATPGEIEAATSQLTCWGDGKLNWRRAPAMAIIARCQAALGQAAVNRMLAMQAMMPVKTIADLAADSVIAQSAQAAHLTEFLADQSTCHSIWIVSHAASGKEEYDLTVLDQTGEGLARMSSFSW